MASPLSEGEMEVRIREFLDFLSVEKCASPNTISAYRSDLHQFADWLFRSQIRDWEKVTAVEIDRFITKLRIQRKTATVARKVAAIKSFFNYLTAVGCVGANPTGTIPPILVVRENLIKLTEQETAALINHLEKGRGSKDHRNLTILQLILQQGLQITQVIGLNLDDVSIEKDPPTLAVGNERTRELTGAVLTDLRRYIATTRPKLTPRRRETALFINQRGERLTRQGVWMIFKGIAKGAGVDPNRVTPQTLRSTFAANCFARGEALDEVHRKMGIGVASAQRYRVLTTV